MIYNTTTKPLRYFENLRRLQNVRYEGGEGTEYNNSSSNNNIRSNSSVISDPDYSQVVQIKDEHGNDLRLIHILNLVSVLNISPFVYMDAAALLALKHFNQRSELIVKGLSQRLQGCNLYMTMDMLNDLADPVIASRKLHSYFSLSSSSNSLNYPTPHPTAVLGATLSDVSVPLAVLTGAYEIPQLSPASQAVGLDNDGVAPTFSRTVPTLVGVAETVLAYLHHLGVSHCYLLHLHTDFALSLRHQMTSIGSTRFNITVYSAAYDSEKPLTIDTALRRIGDSGVRYVFGTLTTVDHRAVLERAYDLGVVGDRYAWFILDVITKPSHSLDRDSDAKYIAGLQGISQVGFWRHIHEQFEESLIGAVRDDPDFQDFYVESHKQDSVIFQGTNFSEMFPIITLYSHFTYDAAMALGIAACEVKDQPLFSGWNYSDQIRKTEFQGATGFVTFDPDTGTRDHRTVMYAFDNYFLDESLSNNKTAYITSQISTVVNLSSTSSDGVFLEINAPVFADGTSRPPLPLIELEQDLNLIPIGILVVGWTLAAVVIIVCISLIIWVRKHRNDQEVRASQPRLLVLLLVGTLVIAASVIPNSFQEPSSQRLLNVACMAAPILFWLGFSIAFAANLTKIWRLSRIIRDSVEMRRTKEELYFFSPATVPFFCILFANIAILVAWALVAPLEWTRVSTGIVDDFGRPLETYGHCANTDSGLFEFLLIGINMAVVLAVFYEAYAKRNLPKLFNDAYQVTLCTACMFETFILGIPALLVVENNPRAFFLVREIVHFALCMAILIPNFGNKLLQHKEQAFAAIQAEWRQFITQTRSSNQQSSHCNLHSHPFTRSSELLPVSFRNVRNIKNASDHEPSNDNDGPEQLVSTVAEIRQRVFLAAAAAEQKEEICPCV